MCIFVHGNIFLKMCQRGRTKEYRAHFFCRSAFVSSRVGSHEYVLRRTVKSAFSLILFRWLRATGTGNASLARSFFSRVARDERLRSAPAKLSAGGRHFPDQFFRSIVRYVYTAQRCIASGRFAVSRSRFFYLVIRGI